MGRQVVRTSLVDQVYELILERIQNRTLRPGDRLNIEELAHEFGVSRTPVRETINRLTQEGFVEQKHNVGPSIVELSDEQTKSLIDANARLFNIVFDTIVSLESYDELKRDLQDMVDRQIKAQASGNDRQFHEAAVGFHKVIIQHCTNPIIFEYTMKTQNQLNMCTFTYTATEEHRQESIDAHCAINDAVQREDFKKAKQLMDEHNRFAGTAYFQAK